MTVNSSYSEITYEGNGTTKAFAVPWKFFDDELVIYKNKTTTVYDSTDYTITNTGNGGTVTFNEAPTGYLTIARNVPLEQQVVFNEGEDFPADDYEYSLDRIYMALQEQGKELARAWTVLPGETTPEEYMSDIQEQLDSKAAADDVYTKEEADGIFATTETVATVQSDLTAVTEDVTELQNYGKYNPYIAEDVEVSPNRFSENTGDSDYPYSAIACDVTTDLTTTGGRFLTGNVVFRKTEALGGNFAPYAKFITGTSNGKVVLYAYIYAKEKPSSVFYVDVTFFLNNGSSEF